MDEVRCTKCTVRKLTNFAICKLLKSDQFVENHNFSKYLRYRTCWNHHLAHTVVTNKNEAAYAELQHITILRVVWARRAVVCLAPQVHLTPFSST